MSRFLELQYNPATDYSSQYGSLFGADTGGDLFYGGPNRDWRAGMQDRAMYRSGTNPTGFGFYENSNRTTEGFDQMAQRNNVVESMLRAGYSMDQMNQHMSGQRNVLQDGPARDPSATGFMWNDLGQAPAPAEEFDFSTNPLITNKAGGGGFLEAYNAKRAELENKPSVLSLFKEMENYEQSPQ